MSLNGKQKRFLRAMANSIKAVVTIGKDGISDNVIDSINDYLDAHELIKISVLKTCDIELNEILIEVLRSTNSELVQTIGKTIILYKPSKERKIILP